MNESKHINEYWETAKHHMENIPSNYIKIWRTDNNGQVSQDKNKEHKEIWPWALKSQTDKGNGQNLINLCRGNDLICPNTHMIPKNKNVGNMATWHIPYATVKRKIDLFAISDNREIGRKIKNNKLANTKQPYKRRILQIYIKISLKNNQ